MVDKGWFDALTSDNVELVTEPISHFTETAIVTSTGTEFQVDLVIFVTGFHANDYFAPIEIVGRNGIDLGQLWRKDGARAHLGITLPGMPNFFSIYGPNTNPRVNGPVLGGEMQTRYTLKCLEAMVLKGWDAVEVRHDAFDRYNQELDKELAKTIWLDPRQRSYFQNKFGRSAVMAPWSGHEYWTMIYDSDLDDFEKSKCSEGDARQPASVI